jgi:hypothetical protein
VHLVVAIAASGGAALSARTVRIRPVMSARSICWPMLMKAMASSRRMVLARTPFIRTHSSMARGATGPDPPVSRI